MKELIITYTNANALACTVDARIRSSMNVQFMNDVFRLSGACWGSAGRAEGGGVCTGGGRAPKVINRGEGLHFDEITVYVYPNKNSLACPVEARTIQGSSAGGSRRGREGSNDLVLQLNLNKIHMCTQSKRKP